MKFFKGAKFFVLCCFLFFVILLSSLLFCSCCFVLVVFLLCCCIVGLFGCCVVVCGQHLFAFFDVFLTIMVLLFTIENRGAVPYQKYTLRFTGSVFLLLLLPSSCCSCSCKSLSHPKLTRPVSHTTN